MSDPKDPASKTPAPKSAAPKTTAPKTTAPKTTAPKTTAPTAAASKAAKAVPKAAPAPADVAAQAPAAATVPPTAPPAVPPVTPVRRRPVWPWVVGGAALLVVLAVGVAIVVFAVSAIVSSRSAERQTVEVEKVVNEFDEAYRNVDCEAFEALVSDSVREDSVDGGYDCDSWQQIAESFVVDGEYAYDVEITDSEVHGNTATVSTTESWDDGEGGRQSADYTYTLKHEADGWIIVKYDEDRP